MNGPVLLDRRRMIALSTGAAILPATIARSQPGMTMPGRVTQRLDLDWRFLRGTGDFASSGTDDANWRRLDLPHDWSVEDLSPGQDRIGPFDKTAIGGLDSGFTVGGEGWYRKHFRLPAGPGIARAEITFDGVAVTCDVWLNGHHAGTHYNSYTAFTFDITPYLDPAGENVLAVRVRNIGSNSRWYSGSGIYRPVRIDLWADRARLVPGGIAAWTREIDAPGAAIDIATEIEAPRAGLVVRSRLRDARGEIAAETVANVSATSTLVRQQLLVRAPRLWSPDDPALYTLETDLLAGDVAMDRIVQPFGIRIATFDAEHGLRINNRVVKLRGGCVHHENGLLGAVAFADAEDRRARLLKARGFNAVRSAHNPCSDAFRHACERHGLLLIEEAFDMWHHAKRPADYAQYFPDHWRDDLRAMVRGARNSPSVILWSIGNEVPDRIDPRGMEYAWQLANEVHRLDPTRPVTAGINGFPGRPVVAAEGTARAGTARRADYAATIFLDVPGYNYRLEEIQRDHARFPDRVYYASESYPADAYDYRCLGERAPYMLGEFVWAAMDYLGEAGTGLGSVVPGPTAPKDYYPHQWPVVNCYEGDLDIIGEQKPQSRMRDVMWDVSPLQMAVQTPLPEGMVEHISLWGWSEEWPRWTWPGHEGEPLAVRLYTSGDRVELRLNGAVVATHTLGPADRMRTEMSVPYAPGVLEAVAWQDGREIARQRVETEGAPARLTLVPERPRGRATRDTLSYVRLDVTDARGGLIRDAVIAVSLGIEGPAELIGFGSANPFATGSLKTPETRTFRGQALVILRSTGTRGAVRLTARADRLMQGDARIAFV